MKPGPLGSFDLEGSILFNGQPAVRNMRGLVAFVEQFDHHHYTALTVRETLRYASILRLPAEVPLKRKIARAEEVLHMLGLGECANNLVGGALLKVWTGKAHSLYLSRLCSSAFPVILNRASREVKNDVSASLYK
jgi:hypothetical protein